jgi:hypothetical protein
VSSEPKFDGAAPMWAIQRIPLLDPVRPALTLLEFG